MKRRIGRTLAVACSVVLGLAMATAQPATAGRSTRSSSSFTTEEVLSAANDDWEPAVAADAFGYVYLVTTRYGAKPPCGDCPRHFLVYRVSSDDGATWGPDRYLCRCRGHRSGQNDPEIVTDARGRVFVAYLNGFTVSFQRSDDHGQTWTRARALDGNLIYSDKPTIAVSSSGRDVYVVFNADTTKAKSGKPYAVVSHDAGHSWTEPTQVADSLGLYWFSGGSTVLPDGTVLAAQDAYHQDDHGTIRLFALRSTDRGGRWTSQLLGESAQQRSCPPHYGCPDGFLGAQATIASDANGRVYFLYNASSEHKGPDRLFLRTSADEGVTWSPPRRVDLEPKTVDHEFPMIAAAGAGDVRIGWMDDRTGVWNTYERRSTDGGVTWSPEARLSNRPDGASYKTKRGFLFPYGDYGQIAIDSLGFTQAAWGEGPSYTGPGGSWYSRGI